MMVWTWNPSTQKVEIGGFQIKACLDCKTRSSLKSNEKRLGRLTRYLGSTCHPSFREMEAEE